MPTSGITVPFRRWCKFILGYGVVKMISLFCMCAKILALEADSISSWLMCMPREPSSILLWWSPAGWGKHKDNTLHTMSYRVDRQKKKEIKKIRSIIFHCHAIEKCLISHVESCALNAVYFLHPARIDRMHYMIIFIKLTVSNRLVGTED